MVLLAFSLKMVVLEDTAMTSEMRTEEIYSFAVATILKFVELLITPFSSSTLSRKLLSYAETR
ncbi:hypothetical protein DJ82_10965 [Halorubrum sp. Ib24]|nr:hypothetical protein DJ82_10965 [Halorubrum sp. Ib24]